MHFAYHQGAASYFRVVVKCARALREVAQQMANYTTLDNFPDLTPDAMATARSLVFSAAPPNGNGWDFTAEVNGNESGAARHKLYRFNANEGSLYDLFTTSFFDPVNLLIYDQMGNAISANNEADDPDDVLSADGALYGVDATYAWRAPYTGTYFVDSGWNQGSRFSFYSLVLQEDRDLVGGANRAPVLVLPLPDQNWVEGQAFQYIFASGTFSDPEGQALGYSATLASGAALPSWLSFNAATRSFSGTPPIGTDDVTVRLRATDGFGLSNADDMVIFTAPPLNRAPVLVVALVDQSWIEGQASRYLVPIGSFSDPEGQTPVYSASLSSGDSLPSWLSFDPVKRQFDGTAPLGTADVTVRVRAADSGGLSAFDDLVIFTPPPPNRAPTLVLPLLDQNWIEARPGQYLVPANTFADPEAQMLSHSAAMIDGSSLPSWLRFDAATRSFSGTPPVGSPDLTVRVRATDTGTLSAFDDVVFFTPANEAESGREIRGFTGNDKLKGGPGADAIYGSKGDDELTGGGGNDTLDGGDDIDTAVYLGRYAEYTIAYDEPSRRYTVTDQRSGRDGIDTLTSIEVFKFSDSTQPAGVSAGGPVLNGTAAADTIVGGPRDETIFGEEGGDTLDGGAGNDRLYGGPGNDTYVLDSPGDIVIEEINEGTDTIRVSFDFSLETLRYVENLVATGAGPVKLTGNGLNNVIAGSAGNDLLRGAAGNDWLQGSGNDDTLDGGIGIDSAVYTGARAHYTLTPLAQGFSVRDIIGPDGMDTLLAVERIEFRDAHVALDLDGNAGTVAKLIGAVFGAKAVQNPLFVGIGLSKLDAGMSAVDLAMLAMAETGRHTAVDIVSLLWTNVVGRAPTTLEAQPYINLLTGNVMSIGMLTLFAADSFENAQNIDLVGLAKSGLVYTDVG